MKVNKWIVRFHQSSVMLKIQFGSFFHSCFMCQVFHNIKDLFLLCVLIVFKAEQVHLTYLMFKELDSTFCFPTFDF